MGTSEFILNLSDKEKLTEDKFLANILTTKWHTVIRQLVMIAKH